MKKILITGLLAIALSPLAAKADDNSTLANLNASAASVSSPEIGQAPSVDKVAAPGFKLKNLYGKDISLSDFKGKWVVLDFWGSWCIWCVRGFPELKEAYAKYKDELVIVGIDCGESEADWKAGVAKYELPWVNVYCPQGSSLTAEYGVRGFPTKAIIDPEGNIRNVTIGHNPEFFTILADLIGK